MNDLYASELLDVDRISDWDDFFTEPGTVDYLREHGVKETFTLLGKTVYVLEYNIEEDSTEEYYVIEKNQVGDEAVAFFASVRYNQKRNGLLKPAIGRYQAIVWRSPNSLKGLQFAQNFVLKFLLETLPKSVIVTTDMRQSKGGRDLWARIVSYAAKSNSYDCYYGLSAKGIKTLIEVKDDKAAKHYIGDIVAHGSAYAFRSAIITRAGTPVSKFLLDPEHTHIISNEVAEALNVYDKPVDLTGDDLENYLYEYYSAYKPKLKA